MHHDSCLVACSCVVSSSCVTCRPSSPSMVELIHFEGCLSSRRHHTGEHVQQFRPQTAFAQFAGIFSLASPLIAAPRFPGVRQDLLTSQPALTECQTPSPNQSLESFSKSALCFLENCSCLACYSLMVSGHNYQCGKLLLCLSSFFHFHNYRDPELPKTNPTPDTRCNVVW